MEGENSVVARVFEEFLKRLGEKDFDPKITEKLRQALVEKKEFGQAALKAAFFDEERPE